MINATTITATTPAHTAGAVSVLVTTASGTNAANTLFTYVAPPTVAVISPASGPTAGGTSVTITGTGFTGASSVTIGGTAAASFSIISDTQITAITPARAAGAVSVLVTTTGGTNAANTLFTYVAAPTVTSIAPPSGSIFGGTSVTITGTGFTGATGVTIGGTAATNLSVVNATTITATTPAHAAGAVSVLITTSGGTNAANTLFTYTPPAPGTPDPTFSGDGIQLTPFAQGAAQARDVVVQADGKTVVAGLVSNAGQNDSLLARYLADGTLDTSFGTGGRVVLDLAGSGRHDLIFSIALQTDGNILVGGRAHNGTNYDFLAARFLANGTLDTSFDVDGKAITPMGTGDDTANDVTVQSDGKVILAGSAFNGTNDDFAVVRYHTDGGLDTSFHGDGKVLTPIGAGHESADAVAVQADGMIITSGYANNGSNLDIALVRYDTYGSLDTSFNGTGKVTTPVGTSDDVGIGMALQPDGKIVVTGYSFNGSANADFALLRYNASGVLDRSFNVTGKFTTAFGSGEDVPYAVAVQPDGRIVAAGYTFNGSNSDMAVLRVNADGSLDTTFDGDGKLTLAPGLLNDRLYGVALAPDGAIVGAGFSDSTGGVAQVAVVRLIGGPNDLLVNGSFESQEAVGPNGAGPWPVGYGDWGGDQAAIITAENGITPYAGSRMLKFVATGAGGAGAGGGSETTQLVDLTPWASQIAAGQLSVGVTMRVNRVTGNASSDTKFVVALEARSGSASSFTMLSVVDHPFLSDNNPSTWELVSGTLAIPAGTTHLEVNLQAVEDIVNDSAAPEFDGHYMDDARLTLNFTVNTPQQVFTNAMTAAGLNGPNAALDATPFNDGVKNLLKYAFNMNLSGPDAATMAPGGTSGLPGITTQPNGINSIFPYEFLRRKNSGLIYTPQKSPDMTLPNSWTTLTDTPTIVPIDATWERVIYEEPYDAATTPKCFGRVQVTLPP